MCSLPSPSSPHRRVLGIGNPLLDLLAAVPDGFVENHGMTIGSACLYDAKVNGENLFEEITKVPGMYECPGGATLNTVRVCQGLLGTNAQTAYAGCVGKDKFAETLERLCEKQNVKCYFSVSETERTGICAVALEKNDRTMCTSLGAATHYKEEHFDWKLIEIPGIQVVYSAGFFLTVCPKLVEKLSQKISNTTGEDKKFFITSLCAEFIPLAFKKELDAVLPYSDAVFGNEIEFTALGKSLFGESSKDKSLTDIIKYVATEIPLANKQRERLVICSQGPLPTLVYSSNGKSYNFEVEPVEKIVDINAAGDSLVGGFIAALLKSNGNISNPEPLIHKAHLAAKHVIQRPGCSFDFSPEEISSN